MLQGTRTGTALPVFTRGFGLAGVSLGFISVTVNVLMLTGPVFMMQVYDRVLVSGSVPTLVVLIVIVGVLYAVYSTLDSLRARVTQRVAAVIDERISPTLLRVAVRTRLIPSTPLGIDLLRDGEQLRAFIAGPGAIGLLDVPWVPVYLAVVFIIHPSLGWLATAGAAVAMIVMAVNEAAIRNSERTANLAAVLRRDFAENARAHASAVVSMGMMRGIQVRWHQLTSAVQRPMISSADRSSTASAINKGFRLLLQSGVLALGAYLVIQQEMSPGMMLAASVIASRALAPIEQLLGNWKGLILARQAFTRIRHALILEEAAEQTKVELPAPRTSLTMSGVAASPIGDPTPRIFGIDFELTAGTAMGVIGPSGSGKSSLARTLVGTWNVLAGTYCLDQAPFEQYGSERRAAFIGYLPQEVELLNETVAANIARLTPGARDEDVIAAAKAAGAHELILSLPNGYNTRLGPDGPPLSGGQRQRIAIARALFGDPYLVVLDEPTSHADADGEDALSTIIASLKERGAIVIVISHRPSSMRVVDKLLIMRDGRQRAFGSPEGVLREHVIAAPSARPAGIVR